MSNTTTNEQQMVPKKNKFGSEKVFIQHRPLFISLNTESRYEKYPDKFVMGWGLFNLFPKFAKRYSTDTQFALLRAMAVIGYRLRWEPLFKSILENPKPLMGTRQECSDWRFFARNFIEGSYDVPYHPFEYPSWLVSYGYTQKQYVKDLSEYWDNIATEYYIPWETTERIGEDLPQDFLITRISEQAHYEMSSIADHAKNRASSQKSDLRQEVPWQIPSTLMQPKKNKFVSSIDFAKRIGFGPHGYLHKDKGNWDKNRWEGVCSRFAGDFQFALLRAMTVTSTSFIDPLFINLYWSKEPFGDIYKMYFEDTLKPDWRFFAERMALWERSRERLWFYPTIYPSWLIPYGYTQEQYIKDLGEYWDYIDDVYYIPWESIHAGVDVPALHALKQVSRKAFQDIDETS